MNISQDKILEYLKYDFISLDKSSNDEEHYMYEFMQKHGFMSPVGNKGTIRITNAGQDFIRNAYLFNPVPLSVYEWKMNIINQLKSGEKIIDGTGELIELAISELNQDGITEKGSLGYYKTLTTKGRNYLNGDVSYNDYIGKSFNQVSTHIGNNIHNSNISHSDFSTEALNSSSTISPIAQTKQSLIDSIFKWLLKNIWKIIIGLIIAALSYFLGFTQNK